MNQYDYDHKILQKYKDYIDHMLEHNSRVIQKRFDGRAPEGFKLTKQHIYRFNDYATRTLKRNLPFVYSQIKVPQNGLGFPAKTTANHGPFSIRACTHNV
jgi:ribosomal protein S17E